FSGIPAAKIGTLCAKRKIRRGPVADSRTCRDREGKDPSHVGYGIRSDIMNIANKNFNVAVVIPIYNAAKYIEKAVESVVHEPEVKEVILIDDGYPDHSVQVCRQL